ncbi:hypothetical protein CCACVL1_13376 [Corchorus capsularis]|uniref:BHLH domain-containing protein n=1 Tax=Corchorus capsularis TaxID=210143 RepID=A0A1R3IBC6_COCAP|nr:hypothetical protein CCACVL1_13376 [Corchorus capsularis]
MVEAEMSSVLKQTLKNLCCSNGWSYGVFWRFDQRNSMMLTMEDAYYEEQMGPLIDNMLLKFHILGEGIIGQAALTGKHQWLFSDFHGTVLDSSANQDIIQDESEFQNQFSSGIKTIAIISVSTRGVVEFGSTQKILERVEFLDETKKLFNAMESFHGLIPLENDTCNLDGHFASLALSGNFYSENLTSSKISLANCMVADTPCMSAWSSDGSILTSFETSLQSERAMWGSSNVHPEKENGLLSGNLEQHSQGGSTFTSFYNPGELVDADLPILDGFRKTSENQYSFGANGVLLDSVISLQRIPEEFNPADFTTDLSNSFTLDDLSQWFVSSPQHNINGEGATLTTDLPCSIGVSSVSSTRDTNIPVRQTANSLQSSITGTCVSNLEKSINGDGNDLFDGVGLDFQFGKTGECLEDIIMPLCDGNKSAVSSGMSSVSELDNPSMTGKRKGLFSELGLEKLLEGVSSSSHIIRSSIEDQFSTSKRRKAENPSSFHQGQVVSCSGRSMILVHHSHNWDKINSSIYGKEVNQKSQVGLWIDDSYSVNAGQAAVATSKKPTRKRAKPGESTRPRPKDRQLIQDRIKELRGIIPHSGKQLSIDLLLERTIKHLLFLQGVTKYADKIKQADEPKLIGQENGTLPKHNKTGGGATWAFEMGAQTIPIVVKDLNTPGQMLIEMLCEDRGFFLEIADVIRGFGLNILKGVMELQEDKIWARFMVEANEQVERTDIIWSLLLLLQQTGNSGTDSANHPNRAMDGGISLPNNFQQPLLMPPVSMAETLQ